MPASIRSVSLRAAIAVLAATAVGAAGCGGGSDSQNPALIAPSTTVHDVTAVTCRPAGTSLVISADNTAYDKDCLAAPVDQPFTIAFANRQKDVRHNVVILKSRDGETLHRGGDPFPGVQTMVYDAPPLPAGDYYFHCEVHPGLMQGKFVVAQPA